MTAPKLTRRAALAAGLAPFAYRLHAAAPSETVRHASFGAAGMAGSDIGSLTRSKNLLLVAVAEVDEARAADIRKRFPQCKVYSDWRELLDKEKGLDSVNVSTPDHMHAPIAMRAMQRGLHVYGQKPLTQTIHEARALTRVAAEKKLVTQMGIQIHSHAAHRTAVATIQAGAIGKVKEVHSWSGKGWGDRNPRPPGMDTPPPGFQWDQWLGVAAARPFLKGYYHPGNWRKRLDFGTGTFGDMGCHILDPVFGALALTMPTSVVSTGEPVGADSWSLDVRVKYTFPGTAHTAPTVDVHWTNGAARPPKEIAALVPGGKLNDQGSIFLGTAGVMYLPYIGAPKLLGEAAGKEPTKQDGQDHYLQYVEAVRGQGKTSAPFAYAGPLTEMVLLGCLATRFPNQPLEWDAAAMAATNFKPANAFVRKEYRKGWEVEGL